MKRKEAEERIKERKQEREDDRQKVDATKSMLLGWQSATVEVKIPFGDKDLVLRVRQRLNKQEKEKFKPLYLAMASGLSSQEGSDDFEKELSKKEKEDLNNLTAEFCDYITEPKMGIKFWKEMEDELGAVVMSAHFLVSTSVFANLDEIKKFLRVPRRTDKPTTV